MRFTDAQLRALEPGGKLVLAGAGSGKTTVLTERYIRLLAPNPDGDWLEPRQIVATTFSKKAAAHLEAKVYKALLSREKEDTEHASHWRKQRERMPWSRISTLHSFCSSLLRSYPLEAGVDPDFIVSAEGDLELQESISDHVRRLAYKKDQHLRALLALLSRAEIEEMIRRVVKQPELWEAAVKAEAEPERATSELNALLAEMLDRYAILDELRPSRINHSAFVEAVQHLAALARPFARQSDEVQRVLFYDDLERMALRLLRRGGQAARMIRGSIRFMMVDEFQDTSAQQWELIKLLARDDRGELLPNKLFLVGDEKQSIYGFRDADVTVVNRARTDLERAYSALASRKRSPQTALAFAGDDVEQDVHNENWFVTLDDNFRTLSEVMEPLNGAFQELLSHQNEEWLPFEAQPRDLAPNRSTQGAFQSHLELLLGVTKESEALYDTVVLRLRELVQGSEPLMVEDPETSEVRALCYEDIGVLFRTRTRMPVFEESLRKADVPYTIAKGRGFLTRQEVLDCMNLLRALADPRDRVALYGTLRSPFFSFSENILALLFGHGDEVEQVWYRAADGDDELMTLLPDPSEREALRLGFELWEELSELSRHSTATEVLLTALEAFGAWAAYAEGLRGEQRVANIYQFIAIVQGIADEGHFTLRRMIKRLEQLRESGDVDTEADVQGGKGIRVLTMHASKGLEFPFVVLPDLATQIRGSNYHNSAELKHGALLMPEGDFAPLAKAELALLNETASSDAPEATLAWWMKQKFARMEERAETLRLLYVAATRARDHLLLIGQLKTKKDSDIPVCSDKSPLAVWLDALHLKINEETGELDGTEDCPFACSLLRSNELRRVEIEQENVGNTGEPEAKEDSALIRLEEPLKPQRWTLPITAFAAYAGDPGDEQLRKLVWYADDEWVGEDESEGTSFSSKATWNDPIAPFGNHIGNLVHHLLEFEGFGWTREAVEERVERAVKAIRGLAPEHYDAARARVYHLLENATKLYGGLNPDVAKPEMPILLTLGCATLRGRADLVLRNGNKGIIVDYKTNLIEPGEEAEAAKAHGYDHQARLYALALRQAWQLEDVECQLAFLHTGNVLSVPAASVNRADYEAAAAELNERWQRLERMEIDS